MTLIKLNVENYLKRISFLNEIQINLYTLTEMHKNHLQSIPFENLDVHYGKKIRLDLKKIETKVVTNSRGGFCYELNALFGALLGQLGFDVKMISARVYKGEKIGQEFDHMVLIVKLDEEWLVDVGFGDNFLEPMRIELGLNQKDPSGLFRIERFNSEYLRLEEFKDDVGFVPKYIFSLAERQLEDYVEMCEYHQTSSESAFTNSLVCTIATENGRVTLRYRSPDRDLIQTKNGHKTVRKVVGDEEFEQILRERFGIEIRQFDCE